MPPAGDSSSTRIVGYAIWLGVTLLIPVVFAAGARRRLDVGWKCFGYGVLVGLVLLAVSLALVRSYFFRLLAVPWLGLSGSVFLIGFYLAVLMEVGRYVGLLRSIQAEERNWDTAVMYGLGLGAASVVVGSFDKLLAFAQGVPGSRLATVPAKALVMDGWTMLCGIAVHVALAVLVLQIFRRGSLRWLWLAILVNMLWHVGPDVLRFWTGPMHMQGNPQSTDFWFSLGDTVTIAAIGLMGLSALWIIYGLRERSKAEPE